MSETPVTEESTSTPPVEKTETPGEVESTPKTFDAEYVRKLREEAANYRVQAKENADAAAREKAAVERAEKAEARALRRDVALDPAGDGSLPALTGADAKLLDSVTDVEAMRSLAKRLSAEQTTKRKTLPVPNEGNATDTGDSENTREFLSRLTRRNP